MRSDIDPPVETRPQVLPFESLAWENFERLCLRLASERGGVDHSADHASDDAIDGHRSAREARLYGVRGQDQQGIDLYVRIGSAREESGSQARRYLCVQSRRVAEVKARHLQEAVSDFLAGSWAPVSQVFVYATSQSAVRRDLADEIRTQMARLEREGMEFQVWDAEQLALWLKDRPSLVYDFFGRVWAEAFCGKEAVSRLGSRLEAEEVIGSYHAHATPRFRGVPAWNAEQLNVHSAVSGQRLGAQEGFVLPEYVLRPHDKSIRSDLERLAAESEPRLLLLRGGSCTGKTRTAYEAVRAALPDWRLAYPKTAEALLVLLNGSAVPEKSVVWLDDLHHLLDEPAGGDAAALLRDLLQKPRRVVLIATAWPDACKELTATPSSGHADRHYHARMLLRQAWVTDIPDTFTGADRQELERLAASDASLTAAMRAAGSAGEVTQTLAAAPELMEHWLHAPAPYGKAVITAAIDARRLGVRAPLPDAFLEAATVGYFSQSERARSQPTWFDEALDYTRQPIKRATSALLPVAHSTGMGPLPGVSDLADYLEQHGAALRWDQVPPAAFWAAALAHLSGGADLERLALNAFSRGRFQLSRDLNLSALRIGAAGAFEGLCFSYIETDRILTQQGRDELVSVVRAAEDGGYSLWYLGQTLWSIHGEPGGGGEETLSVAGELLSDSYEAGYLLAAFPLAELCAAIGVDARGLLADARQKEAERAASSPQDFARKWQHRFMTAPGADGSITPSALLSLLAKQTVDDYVIQASVLRWWQECPQETRDLLDFCCRSSRFGGAIDAARTLLKLPEPAARRMGEDVLARLADDGHSGAQMELAHWRIQQWQQGDPATDEAVPQNILILLEEAAKNQTEARRLLGQVARRRGDTAEAEKLFRGALDGGDYTVLPELAEVLHPHSPEDARQLALSGLDADGSPCPPW